MAKPESILIPHDDYHFHYVGRFSDGSQFLACATGAWPIGQEYGATSKRWLAVVHRFDAQGNHIGTECRLGGFDTDDSLGADKALSHLDHLLNAMLGDERPVFGDILVKLFSVEIGGVRFGLIHEQSEEAPEPGEERGEWVMLEPRDIMFHPPWDSGEYST